MGDLTGLPKKYIKKYGVTKKAWEEYRKAQTSSKRGKTKMAKPKKRRRRSYSTKKRRKPRDKRIPAETAIAGISIPFTPAASGFASPWDCVQSGDFQGLFDNLKTGFIGFEPTRGSASINLLGLLNPLDMEHGRYSKMLAYSGLAYKIRAELLKRLGGIQPGELTRRIPFIGRMVK